MLVALKDRIAANDRFSCKQRRILRVTSISAHCPQAQSLTWSLWQLTGPEWPTMPQLKHPPGGTTLWGRSSIAERETPGPATFQGFVTATTGTAPAAIDALLSAIQTIPASSGGTMKVTIPAEGASLANISLASTMSCPTGAPANSNCASYALIEPASNPSVGTFAAAASFHLAVGDVPIDMRQCFVPRAAARPIAHWLASTSSDKWRKSVKSHSRPGGYTKRNRFFRVLLNS